MLTWIGVSFNTNLVTQKLNNYGSKYGILRAGVQIIGSLVWFYSSDLKPCNINGVRSCGNIFSYSTLQSQLELKSCEMQSSFIRDFKLKYLALILLGLSLWGVLIFDLRVSVRGIFFMVVEFVTVPAIFYTIDKILQA